MAIEFACSSCGELVRVGEAAAGKKGKCPHCAAVVQIPAAAGPAASPAATPAAATVPKKSNQLAFRCHRCGKTINAPPAMIGKRGKCPFCQAFLMIGSDHPPPAPQQPQLVELTPIDDGLTPIGGLTPLPSVGLTPLDSGGLVPLGGNPLDELASLPSLGAAPLAPMPQYASKPLAASNPLGVTPGLASYSMSAYGGPAAAARRTAPVKLMIPAIGMLGIAVLSIVMLGYQALQVLLYPIVLPPRLELQLELHGDPTVRESWVLLIFIGQLVVSGIGTLVNLGVIAGGIQMIRMSGLGMAKTGAILALIPCSPCCLNLPFAIWGLIVLGQDDVWRRFRS